MAKKDKDEREIVDEAQKRFNRCETWEGQARARWLDDIKFCNADTYNMWQWPPQVLQNRGMGTGDERPNLTINKTRQHCLQVINDARQNKSSIKIIATGNQATKDSADVMEGLVRHIEYISNAQAAYGTAIRHQVQGGLGFTRVITDYAGDNTLDQDIFIKRVGDPMAVYLDPDTQEADGSDARFGFVFERLAKDLFEQKYPKYKDAATQSALDNANFSWDMEDHVMVAEYYRKVEADSDKIVYVRDPMTGEEVQGLLSEVPEALKAYVVDDPAKQRTVANYKIEWFKIVGSQIVEKRDWPGKYIPIVPWIGETTVIEGILDRKGHTRALLDPQRIYNYNASAAVEYGALQSKIPYIGPAQAIESNEDLWETANTVNHSILTYNHLDDAGNIMPPPQRQAPPMAAPVFIQGMVNAAEDMRMVSGQYQAEMGAPSNETSGVAIERRQRQGDNATYHYIDHQAMAMRFLGKIIVDLIPKIYETRRILKIMAEDGSATDVTIDPQAPQAHQVMKSGIANAAEQIVLNPSIGEYDVEVDIGPAFATRRQEQFAALSQIASQNKEVMQFAGDLIMQAADFPMAEELAERLKRTIPPAILGEEDENAPKVAQLEQQLQAMQQMMGQMAQQLADKNAELSLKRDQKSIDAYDAETKRMGVFKEAFPSDLEGVTLLVRKLVDEARSAPPPGFTLVPAEAPQLPPEPAQPPQLGQGGPDMGQPMPSPDQMPQQMPEGVM